MRVLALRDGFHTFFRHTGDEFEIASEKEFSSKWMKKIDKDPSGFWHVRNHRPEEPAVFVRF